MCTRAFRRNRTAQQHSPSAPLNPFSSFPCGQPHASVYVIYECTATLIITSVPCTRFTCTGWPRSRKCVQKVNITHARAKSYFEKIHSLFAVHRQKRERLFNSIYTCSHSKQTDIRIRAHIHIHTCPHAALSRISRRAYQKRERTSSTSRTRRLRAGVFCPRAVLSFCRHRRAPKPKLAPNPRNQSVAGRRTVAQICPHIRTCTHTLRRIHTHTYTRSKHSRFASTSLRICLHPQSGAQ